MNLRICLQVFLCTFKKFCVHSTYTDMSLYTIFQALAFNCSGVPWAVPLTIYIFFYNLFYKKISLKSPKTVRKFLENLQPSMSELQFLRIAIFPRTLRFKFSKLQSYKIE